MRDAFLDLLRRLLNLCRKEFLAVLKDPKSRTILVLPALVQSMLFGYAATYDLNDVPYALVDDSHGATAAQLVGKLDGTGVFRHVATVATPAGIRDVIDTQRALLVLHIPRDFERRLYAGEQVPVQLILDGRNSNTAGSAGAYVSAVIADFNRQWRERHGGTANPLEVQTRAWFNPNMETRWNLMPGLIASLSMLQTLLLTALSVAREREQGTFDQLLVTPMTPAEIMVGKALPPICIGLVQSTLILLVTRFWFHVPMAGSLVALYGALTLFTVACVGIGLAISAVAASMQQAMLYTFVLVMPLMLLSGLTTPIRNMPAAMQTLTWANPLRFAIDMVQRIYLEGVGLAVVWHDMIPLCVIAAVTLPIAAWMFRNRLV
ncbi:ABC-2 type transport system permease protein [Pseudoduganella flava]|uniref:Transport permease protein n=1 Tax=Pseudoduganella flava TaxID=871742 RepID=A0A562Q3D0_9BURK|nr:ABC transporter permease [Pseudoduganella flava]QGZ41251.1 ABC transporter permease [Pseudoduganella flava]TWI51188.1 ABC-2 type transport system permease protein [Pseudoduganella flava]